LPWNFGRCSGGAERHPARGPGAPSWVPPLGRGWRQELSLAGIITERDIVRAVAERRDLSEGTAGEYMTWEPATVALETPLSDVARRMLALGVHHLPVMVAGEVLGMVSARDLLELESATSD
jgi:CBS domain-containing protein